MPVSKDNGRPPELMRVYGRLYSAYGPQGWWPVGGRRRSSPDETPSPGTAFEIMVGAVLTQNTAWVNVEKALRRLRGARCLSPGALRRISLKRLAGLIRPAGYFNVKARRLKNFTEFVWKEYGGSVRRMSAERPQVLRDQLLSVNGIGPETADSILLYAMGRPWFVVDAYTKRIFARHGWVGSDANYHRLQTLFMGGLPRRPGLYNEYHALIVKLGKETCRPKPICDRCPLLEVLGEPVNVP